MTLPFVGGAADLAVSAGAEHIVSALADGNELQAEVLRNMLVDVMAAMLTFTSTPASDVVDDAVEEALDRWVSIPTADWLRIRYGRAKQLNLPSTLVNPINFG
jgi:hypothetical protein